jgi:rRNA small subunit pseudouridine methyltransferase Nep1
MEERLHPMVDEVKKDGPVLSLILVDSELEIVPKEFWSHPAVVQNARKRKKKPSTVLLDSSLHYSLFGDPEERNRRGRPDIVHQFLLLGLDSILNSERRLKLFIHTRNNELITIDPTTRLPKNYNRYSGLFEELFRSGAVPSGKDPLINLRDSMDLKDCIKFIKNQEENSGMDTRTILLHPEGDPQDPWIFFSNLIETEGADHIICMIGGFSHGDFISDVHEHADMNVTLPGGLLKVWTVISELVVTFRRV